MLRQYCSTAAAIAAAVLALTGCVPESPSAALDLGYQRQTGDTLAMQGETCPSPDQVHQTQIPANAEFQEKARRSMVNVVEDGYLPFGASYLRSAKVDRQEFENFAKSKGACYALVIESVIGTQVTSVPIVLPTIGMATTTSPIGSIRTVATGTRWTSVTTSTERLMYNVILFGKTPRRGMGFAFGLPTPEERQTYETNMLCKVMAVRRDSPAWKAGLLTGDFIRSAEGEPTDCPSLVRVATAKKGGETLNVEVLRGQRTLKLQLPVVERY